VQHLIVIKMIQKWWINIFFKKIS